MYHNRIETRHKVIQISAAAAAVFCSVAGIGFSVYYPPGSIGQAWGLLWIGIAIGAAFVLTVDQLVQWMETESSITEKTTPSDHDRN